ncbi:MAG: DUF5916 domain-containing protein [Ignavibacteria bacterium]|jgi:hypothetical protein
MKLFFSIWVLTLGAISIFAVSKDDSPAPIKSYKLAQPLDIDGILSEPLYQQPAITKFTRKEPEEGGPASERTYIWVSHDESNIYFSGRFYDSDPDSIDISLMRRDNVTVSDWFWIYIDPYNDNRTGNYFAVNAGGSICDGTIFNDQDMDDSWDGIWEAETNVDEKGWTAEVRIPFTQLRFKEADKMVWGLNLNRDIKRKQEMSFYVMVPNNESGFTSRFADLVGLDGIKSRQRFEILPYLVQKVQYLRHDADDPYYKSKQYKTLFGADLKMSFGSNLNLDVTINPDFGQVEVDPAVINLSAFETFYDEKRPFFIEGANIFNFGIGGSNNQWGFGFSNPTLFYSRRIGRPPQGETIIAGIENYPNETRILGAAKLTGKLDESWSIGVLSAFTERTYATIRTDEGIDIEEEVEPLTHYGVFRTRKEFNNGNQAIGMIFTSVNRDLSNQNLRNVLSRQAYTYGLDGWTFLDEDEAYVITGSVIGSYAEGSSEYIMELQKEPYRYLQRPDKTYMPLDTTRTSISGYYSRVMINKQSGNYYLNAALGVVSPGFHYNDLGSQWFADEIYGHIVNGYRWYEEDGLFRRKGIYFTYNRSYNYEGYNIRNQFFVNGYLQFLNFWGIEFSGSYDFESVSSTLTRGGPIGINPAWSGIHIDSYTDNRSNIIVSTSTVYESDELGSKGFTTSVELLWKPSPQIDLSFSPAWDYDFEATQWVGDFEDEFATATYNKRYVFAELEQKSISANIRLNWTFSPSLSLQLFIQPLFAVGRYTMYKELARPLSKDYNVYGQNESEITYDSETNEYTVDPDANGPSESFSFENPDFNFKSLRGSAVLRWEYMPGSVLYFVWTHDKVNEDNPGGMNLKRDFRSLWASEANNVFLVKFSYWFDI